MNDENIDPCALEKHSLPSVECQTEWSWLASMKEKRVEGIESLSINLECDKDDVAKRLTNENAGFVIHTDAIMSARPYPSRDDEYGIPVEKKRSVSDSWLSKEEELESVSDEYSETDSNSSRTSSGSASYDHSEHKRPILQALEMVVESLFEGVCQFCGHEKKPFPSLDEQEVHPPVDLYCCNEYREYINNVIVQNSVGGMLGDNDSIPHGKRNNTKKYRSKGALRSNGIDRQNVEEEVSDEKKLTGEELHGQRDRQHGRKKEERKHRRNHNTYHDIPELTSVPFAQEMTTINYQLSSKRCLDRGWTVILPSLDIAAEPRDGGKLTSNDQQELPQFYSDGKLVIKTYSNGTPFLVVFPDGSGNVFYPSGRVAITVIADEAGRCSYIIHNDVTSPGLLPPILAVFDTCCNGVVYYVNGEIRMSLNAIGGIELDENGTKKRKWLWNINSAEHCIHAPPLYPISCNISTALGLHIVSRDNMTLTYTRKGRACSFNIGATLKTTSTVVDSEYDKRVDLFDVNEEYRMKIHAQILVILNKVTTLIRHPQPNKIKP